MRYGIWIRIWDGLWIWDGFGLWAWDGYDGLDIGRVMDTGWDMGWDMDMGWLRDGAVVLQWLPLVLLRGTQLGHSLR